MNTSGGDWYPVPEPARGPVMVGALVIVGFVFALMVGHLEIKEVPLGIVDLELAGTTARASEILRAWDQAGVREFGKTSLSLDLPFIVAYALGIGAACALAAEAVRSQHPQVFLVGALLAWGQLVAGTLDLVEDAALGAMLAGAVDPPWPEVAKVAAILKFSLIGGGVVYCLGVLISRARGARPRAATVP